MERVGGRDVKIENVMIIFLARMYLQKEVTVGVRWKAGMGTGTRKRARFI